MLNLTINELKAFGSFFKVNYREIVVTGMTALILSLNKYHPIEPQPVGSLVYFIILPILTIAILLRRNPLDFGLRAGNRRIWGFHVAAALVVSLPVLYFASYRLSLQDYYSKEQFDLLKYSIETVVSLFGVEFLVRGFLLFGLKDKFKEGSILVQMIPFVLLHFGKPEIETISCIFTGIYFGYVVYRGNSFWPAYIIHIVINISFLVFVNLLRAAG